MAECEHSWMIRDYEQITTCKYCGMLWDDWNAVYVAELEKEGKRLDWLQKQVSYSDVCSHLDWDFNSADNLRQAIDKAMEGE